MTRDDEAPSVEDVLAEFIARREDGESIDVDAFARRYPALEDEIRDALRAFEAADSQLPDVRNTLPRRIDSWRIRGFVGEGSFGRVLRAERDAPQTDSKPETAGKHYALKLMHEGSALSPRSLERFQRECKALRDLDHPGIVRCHDFGVFGSCPYVVLDLIRGPSLADLAQSARMRAGGRSAKGKPRIASLFDANRDSDSKTGDDDEARRVARLVAKIARSVQALHDQDLLHRDLKPANVILDDELEAPILIDLGLVGGEATATLTVSGEVLGTPAYMAPEQARGESCDARSDVYGLGGILFELLTLEPPRTGRSSGSAHEERLRRQSRRIRIVDPRAPRELAKICERALAFDPKWRHSSAAELAEDLESYAKTGRAKTGDPGLPQRLHEAWTFQRGVVLAFAAAGFLAASTLAWLQIDSSKRAAEQRQLSSAMSSIENKLNAKPRDPSASLDDELRSALASDELADALLDYLTGRDTAALEKSSAFASSVTNTSKARSDWQRGLASLIAGLASLRLGDAKSAATQLATASKHLPQSNVAIREHLHALRLARDDVGARAVAARLMVRPDLDAKGWHEIAKYSCDQKDLELGRRALRAMERLADEPSLAMLNTAAVIASSAGDMDLAHKYYARIRDVDPKYVVGRLNEAYSLDRQCRLDEARATYESVLALDPEQTQALGSLAWLHAGSKRETCEKCQAQFTARPELYDVELATAYMLRSVEASRAKSFRVLRAAIDTAKKIDRGARLRQKIVEMQQNPNMSHTQIGRLTRALQLLDA